MKNKTLKNIFIALVFIFLFLPIIILVIYSFNTSKMNIIFEGFTFEWYKTMLTNTDLLEAFANTLIIAITRMVSVGSISAAIIFHLKD